jgi:hypothetical protein
LNVSGLIPASETKAQILGSHGQVIVTATESGMLIESKDGLPADGAITVKITPVPNLKS